MEQQAGPSLCSQSAHQSKVQVSIGAELHEEGGANQWSPYCKEELMRGGEELSFEELRAERYNQQKQKEMEEKMKHLKDQQEQLSQELEEKKRLLLLMKARQVDDLDQPPAAAPFQIFDESQSGSEEPVRNPEPSSGELADDVFLRPDEKGLCVKVQLPPRPGQNHQRSPAPGNQGQLGRNEPSLLTEPDLRTEPDSESQKAVSKPREKLSPIQEASVEAGSLTSLGELSACNSSPLDQNQNQNQMDHSLSPNPCDPEVRRQLLQHCDISSSPDLKSEQRPLPAVEENSVLDLGGDIFYIEARCLDGGSFSLFRATAESGSILIKVDSCSVPWDFHLLNRLKENTPPAGRTPRIRCVLFEDGCITVYTPPEGHLLTGVTDCGLDQMCVGVKAVGLLELVLQLHSCSLLHAGLQPGVLASCHRGLQDWLFPVDWSASLDLVLQKDVTSVQQLPSAQTYIHLGLLEPTEPPHMVDLVGVAETVYFLLTNNKMIPVKDGNSWTVEQYGGDGPCDIYSSTWRRFFRLLLNAGGRSSISILSELKEKLSSLYL